MSLQKKLSQKKSTTLALKIIPVAFTAFISANVSAGFPTLYGKVFLTLNEYDLEKNAFTGTSHIGATGVTTELKTTALDSTGSRIGILGDFGAAYGTTIIYRVEYGIDVDNGTNSNGRELTQRNIYGGVRGDWGQVIIGKNDTPLKTLQTNSVLRSDIDRFNDYPLADFGSYLAGENRPDNVIQYSSPILFGGIEVNIAAIQAEETGVSVSTGTTVNEQNDNGFATGKSISVVYGKAKWFVGAAYETNVATADTFRGAGEITLGSIKLGAIFQTSERHENYDTIGGLSSSFIGTSVTTLGAQNGLNPLSEWDGVAGTAYKKQNGYVINGAWKFSGPWTAKLQFGHANSTPSNLAYDDVKTHAASAGLDFKLSDASRIFAYYATLKTKGDIAINTEASVDNTLGLGLDFKF